MAQTQRSDSMNQPMWRPDSRTIEQANLTAFTALMQARHGRRFRDYGELHQWSIDNPALFWGEIWDYAGVVCSQRGERVVVHAERMPGAQWFPDARLNFAENLLRRRDDAPALIFRGEDQVERRLSYRELYEQVALTADGLRRCGVGVGDRVAAYLPNIPEAVVCMLAATSIGAIWSSSSPDFGAKGVLDRFGQIEPSVLITADGYFYNGKRHDSLAKVREVAAALPTLEQVIVVAYTGADLSLEGIHGAVDYRDLLADSDAHELMFEQLPFDHPLYILFSSGTTGVPKCIVHGVGGTLLQHQKEHLLHVDLHPDDRLFYFTTCGWMMWNWLVSGLASGACLMLYDGSPFYPDGNVLFDYVEQERIDVFGTSAKFIDACNKAGVRPATTHELSSLRSILSTGSPLVPEAYDYVYEHVKHDLCLSSISGGTDIVSAFVVGSPTLPVWRGELQCKGLGLAVEVFNDAGESVQGEKGELVCTRSFPCMPVGFWNDNGTKYHRAYFERFPGVWHHGDYVELTDHGGMIIYGRSDAVLNPGGVRIGTAEIYRQAEGIDEVLESLVIGQRWRGDVRVVLFVRLREGVTLDAVLEHAIRQRIRSGASPRHVPAKIVQVADIPRTKSGKIVELAVRSIVHDEPVKNLEALANPEALELFAGLPELQRE